MYGDIKKPSTKDNGRWEPWKDRTKGKHSVFLTNEFNDKKRQSAIKCARLRAQGQFKNLNRKNTITGLDGRLAAFRERKARELKVEMELEERARKAREMAKMAEEKTAMDVVERKKPAHGRYCEGLFCKRSCCHRSDCVFDMYKNLLQYESREGHCIRSPAADTVRGCIGLRLGRKVDLEWEWNEARKYCNLGDVEFHRMMEDL